MSLWHRLVPHEKQPENPVPQLEFHPLADIFPMMNDEAFAALTADIREHGQLEMIVTHEGMILDGRNRYRACEKLGVEPKTIEWSGIGSPQAFVVSHNLHRRHLSGAERALIAATLATLRIGQRADVQAKKQAGRENPRSALSAPQAAALLGVSPSYVQSAKIVLRDGTSEEIAAVKSGEVGLESLADKIRAKVPAKDRLKKNPVSNAARHATQLANGKMWRTFKEALVNLTGLPLPSDVVRIVRGQDRHNVTNEKLLPALQWLTEFSDAWTSPSADTQANSRRKGKSARKASEAPPAQEAEAGPLGDGGGPDEANGHWLGEDHSDAGEGGRSSGAQLA